MLERIHPFLLGGAALACGLVAGMLCMFGH